MNINYEGPFKELNGLNIDKTRLISIESQPKKIVVVVVVVIGVVVVVVYVVVVVIPVYTFKVWLKSGY